VLDTVYRIMLDAVSYTKSVCVRCLPGINTHVIVRCKPDREVIKAKDRDGPVAISVDLCLACVHRLAGIDRLRD
jgi:hypothetical protein